MQVDAGPEGDEEERARLALRLRNEIDDLDAASANVAREGDLPPGAKGGDAVAWGTLLVSLVSSGALTALITTVNSWVGRQRRGSVSIKLGEDDLVLTGASSADQRRIIEEWLERHQSSDPRGLTRG